MTGSFGSAACDRFDTPFSGVGDRTAVVFVHGYLSVTSSLYWWGLRRIRRDLQDRGLAVVASCQPRTGGVESRAAALAGALEALPHTRLMLVGHSMGGLDARFVASRLDPRRRISHVVTLGTPHLGTSLAEWALGDLGMRCRLARLLDRGALRDMTPEGAALLDCAMPDRDDVVYTAIAGACAPALLTGPLRELGAQLADAQGPNDGLVPAHSAAWGNGRAGWSARTVDADHWDLIGAPAVPGFRPRHPVRSIAILRRQLLSLLPATRSATAAPLGS